MYYILVYIINNILLNYLYYLEYKIKIYQINLFKIKDFKMTSP